MVTFRCGHLSLRNIVGNGEMQGSDGDTMYPHEWLHSVYNVIKLRKWWI